MGFTLLVAFNDIFFMSLMFLLSGVFVWDSLKRKGAGVFFRDRLRRLGVPFLVSVVALAPLAYYPSYLAAAGPAPTPTPAGFVRTWLSLGVLPAGPGLVHLGPLDVRRSHRRGLHARADMGRSAGPSRRASCPASITELPAADHRLGARLHSPRAYCQPS
jgi:hypothetical protein